MTIAKRPVVAKALTINGIVQGVGFRPFIYQLARDHGITGDIANTRDGVLIHAQGAAETMDVFLKALPRKAPPLSRITEITVSDIPPDPARRQFHIHLSQGSHAGHTTLISPDVAVCRDCLRELFDTADRRHRYPFINCTNCGPRYTIIESIPYDRPKTAMKHFKMCPACQAEYDNPLDRRFHAQPNACPACGPHVTLLDASGAPVEGDDPVALAVKKLKGGHILAVKGLGGYHLAVDAGNRTAVRLLRTRKHREAKPFALMSADLNHVRRFAVVLPAEAALLESAERPIVLLEKKYPAPICPGVSPDNRYFGVMLAYTPLHYLLLREHFTALVMTSGNISETPIAINNQEALHRLSGIADFFLVHNRDIYLRSDDSIVFYDGGSTRLIRRSRGYVPMPVFLKAPAPTVMACGAELKNTICLTKGDRAFPSQHIGDMENLETESFFEETIRHFMRILDVTPTIVAHDLHPDYRSTRYAGRPNTALPRSAIRVAVQHHHAHIASCMAENKIDEPVIGLALDGTGYGADGCIWGGEVLIADLAGYKRAAHLAYTPLPGGDAAVREPFRMALAYLYQILGDDLRRLDLPVVRQTEPQTLTILCRMMDKNINAPLTSSLGRLFDGVAALLGIRRHARYEGQAAMGLEMIAAQSPVPPASPYPVVLDANPDEKQIGSAPMELPVAPIITGIVDDIRTGLPASTISAKFHHALIHLFSDVCERLSGATGLRSVAMSGGVFQNRILSNGLKHRLEQKGFTVYTHSLVPCNDAGLSLGQAVAAAAMHAYSKNAGEK